MTAPPTDDLTRLRELLRLTRLANPGTAESPLLARLAARERKETP